MARKPDRIGREPKLNPERQEIIRTALISLCKHETAANLAGVSLRTFYRWRRWGDEDPTGPYGDFCRVVRGAEAQAQQSLSASVALAAETDGRLALDALRARWPRLWPKEPSRIQLNGKLGLQKLTDEQLERELTAALAAPLTASRDRA